MSSYIVRQAILDTRHSTVGYEVHAPASAATSGSSAPLELLTEPSVMREISGAAAAYLPADPRLVLERFAGRLPPGRTVIEVPAPLAGAPEAVVAASALQAQGFRVAIDGVTMDQLFSPLAKIADVAKLDLSDRSQQRTWPIIAKRFAHTQTPLLAGRADHPGDIPLLQDLGFQLFQGAYFAKPSPVVAAELQPTQSSLLAVLTELRSPDFDIGRVADAVGDDLALSHKLLTLVNSAALGVSQHVTSVRQAVGLLGVDEVRRWLAVASVQLMAPDKPAELVLQSLVRARFCEAFARQEHLSSRAGELYLMGLFSLIDAILDQPMASVLSRLPLAPEITAALLGTRNAARIVLDLVLAYEQAQWSEVEAAMEQHFQRELDVGAAYREALITAAASIVR